jgi:predicted secreted protein
MNTRYVLPIIALVTLTSQAQLYKEPITTREDAIFSVKLTSSPTTGYDWFWGNKKELKDSIQLIKTEFQINPSYSGAPGKKVFSFRALKSGRISLKFIKRKTWEEKEADHKIIKVFIKKRDVSLPS